MGKTTDPGGPSLSPDAISEAPRGLRLAALLSSPTPSPLVSFLYIQGTQQHRAYFACVFNCRSVSNQSIRKEINPGCSLEGLMLKLKLRYFGHLIRRADSLKWTLMLGEIEGLEEKGTTEDEMAG